MGFKDIISAFNDGLTNKLNLEGNIVSLRNSRFLRLAQRYLFMSSLAVALGLLLVILLPIVIPIFNDTDFSGAIQALLIIFIFIAICSTFIGFVRINIRSGAEQDEERLREIDFKLKVLQYNIDHVVSQDYDRHLLLEEVKGLKFEKSLLINESPRGWEQEVSTVWGKTLIASHNRLLDEERRLLARNRANLSYGVFAAGVGVAILIVIAILPFITDTSKIPAFNNIPVYYFSSVPIAIISEIVAIFFLRLFASTEQSIERNKNEMTNIELRLTASQLLESKDTFGSLADTLSKEERNFILRKNETSATSETLDTEKLLEIISKLALKAGGAS